jgi:hypothetical protein
MNDNMDRILGREEELIPSSGFVTAVMERIREEATAPAQIHFPPIPFPWKRVVPGIVLACAGLGWGAVELTRLAIEAMHDPQPATVSIPDALLRPMESLGWVALALGLALGSWLLARRVSGESRLL